MNDYARRGNIVVGVMLVGIGLVMMMDRAGMLDWVGRWTLWPVLFFGLGLARFLQTPPGAPRQGMLLMTVGAWLFLAEIGWLSLADSWPLLVVAIGLAIALNSIRPRPADGAPAPLPGETFKLTPLAVIGIWIAAAVAVHTHGAGWLASTTRTDRPSIVSVMGEAGHESRASAFDGASMTAVMGKSELDLRGATIAPGGEASVDVFALMGGTVVRVPSDWIVDVRATPVMGRVTDQRFVRETRRPRRARREPDFEVPSAPPETTEPVPSQQDPSFDAQRPRLVLRGYVVMGGLIITS